MRARSVCLPAVSGDAAGWRTVLAYGGLGMPLAFVALPIYVHVPALYAQHGSLSLAAIGSILLFARLWDALIDPLIGWWADRHPAAGSARLRFIALAAPCLILGFAALMNPPATAGAGWLLLSLFVVYSAYSVASVNHQAWGAELAQNVEQRTGLTASREGFALLGVVLASALPGLIAPTLAEGLGLIAWLFAGLLVLGVLGAASGVPRMQPEALVRSGEAPVLPVLWRVFSRPRFRALLAVFALSGVAAAIPATLVLFFIADVLQAERLSGIFLAVYFIAAACGLPVWVRLSRVIGRLRAWLAGMLMASAAFVWAAFLGEGQLLAYGLVCVLSGLALGADLAMPSSLLADQVAEDAELGAGSYFGWWNLVSKLNLALAAGLALPLLQALGYTVGAREAQPLFALATVYALLPAVLKLAAVALLWTFRHRIEEHKGS